MHEGRRAVPELGLNIPICFAQIWILDVASTQVKLGLAERTSDTATAAAAAAALMISDNEPIINGDMRPMDDQPRQSGTHAR